MCGDFPRLRRGCGHGPESFPTKCYSQPSRLGEQSTRVVYGVPPQIRQKRNAAREEPFARPTSPGHSARQRDWEFCPRGWRASFRSRRRRRFWSRGVSIDFLVGTEIRRLGRNSRRQRCFAARCRGWVICMRGRKNSWHPRIRCRLAHVGRRFCSGRGQRWEGGYRRGD